MIRCKICESLLRKQIDDYIQSGSRLDWVKEWCKEKGLSVNVNQLKKHTLEHLNLSLTDNKFHTGNYTNIDDNFINFENYCISLGLKSEDFVNLDKSLNKIIYGSQKALNYLI